MMQVGFNYLVLLQNLDEWRCFEFIELSEVYLISKQLIIKLQFYCTKNYVNNSINKTHPNRFLIWVIPFCSNTFLYSKTL